MLLLLIRTVLNNHVGDDEMRIDDAADAHPTARNLLDDQRVGQERLPETAILFGDHQSEHPELLQAVDYVLGVLVPVFEFVSHRKDLGLDEVVNCGEDVGLVVGQTIRVQQSTHRVTSLLRLSRC